MTSGLSSYVGEPEVSDLYAHRFTALHQNICSTEVSMIHTVGVQVLQAASALQRDVQDQIQWKRL